jgi:lipopolysaccharide biosynthesis glycosyltransferase
MTAVRIACAAERNYVAHSAAMLHSVLQAQSSAETEIHYLHGDDLTARLRNRLSRMVGRLGGRISFVEVSDAMCSGLPTKDFTRKATWYRIFLPELLADLDRVIWLDVDLIARESLEPLWERDLGNSYLAAVTNVFEDYHAGYPRKLGMLDSNLYFNAGVMLMNLALMRRDGCQESMRRIAVEEPSRLTWRDQDALNLVLAHRRMSIHPRWNCMNAVLIFGRAPQVLGAKAVAEARRDPAIRHFEGPLTNKPWHLLCEHPMRELYFAHRRQTPWRRTIPEGITLGNVARRAKRSARRRASAATRLLRAPQPDQR